jgi:hypothetical protein
MIFKIQEMIKLKMSKKLQSIIAQKKNKNKIKAAVDYEFICIFNK